MKLSTQVRYAVSAMVELALNYRRFPLSVRIISRRQKISTSYLEQLLYRLGKAGLVESMRGPKGGFSLKKDPRDIQILEIVEALGEVVSLVYCLDKKQGIKQCTLVDSCVSRLLWKKLGDRIREVLSEATLDDLRQEAKRRRGKELPAKGYVFNI